MKNGTPGFNGERLREGREARGISATSLADLLGVSRSMVTYYESGAHTPQPEVFESLCQVLNLPRAFFLQPSREEDEATIFFRSSRRPSRLPVQDRLKVRRRHGWLKDIVDYLRHFFDFPEVNIPRAVDGAGFLRLTEERIERIAADCRQQWGLGNGPIPDVILALETNGVIVSRSEFEAENIDAHSKWAKDQTPFSILGDDKGSAARSRFDAAHELGHYLLHRDVDETTEDEHHDLLEAQANRFASAFLLPADSFTRDFFSPNLDEFLNLAEKWRVSVAAQIERCRHLGIVDDDEYKRLRIQLSRRGWIKGEPHDGRMKVEEPRLLSRSFKMLVEHNVQSVGEISSAVPVAPNDIEQLANLPPGFLNPIAKIQPLPRLRPEYVAGSGQESGNNRGGAKIYDLFDGQ